MVVTAKCFQGGLVKRILYLCAIALLPCLAIAQVTVSTAQYGNDRTNANMAETVLSPANVNPASFGKLFSRAVDDSMYAWPVYVPNLMIPRVGTRNIVFVCTMSNTVYAFDADNPAAVEPLWSRKLGPPSPGGAWTGPVNFGILSTPVVDVASSTIYVTHRSGSNGEYFLNALDLVTGSHKFGSPQRFSFTFQSGLTVTSVPAALQRAALTLVNGILYVAFAVILENPSDMLSQEGFIQSFDATDLTRRYASFQVTPGGKKGGIWQAGRGLAADSAGNLYVATAVGQFDGTRNFGSSYLRLNSNVTVASLFSPSNREYLYRNNLDPSANGMTLIPGTDMVFGGGKDGQIHLMNRTRLDPPLQSFLATNGCTTANPAKPDCAQTPGTAFWNRSPNPVLYIWDRQDNLRAFTMMNSRFQTPGTSGPAAYMVGGPTVSANGSANGIVWALTTTVSANEGMIPAALRAFDASTLAEIYSSDTNSMRDAPGAFTKFAPPVIANGRVYVVTHANALQVYGLLCGRDITSQVHVARSGLRYSAALKRWNQRVTVTNNSATALGGTFELALDGLAPHATLANGAGSTSCAAPVSPYAKAEAPPLWLMPGQSITFNLDFTATSNAPINYTPRVLAGSGSR